VCSMSDQERILDLWETPDGPLTAMIYEEYLGLRGQQRLGLVDSQGRVYHYDADLVHRAMQRAQHLCSPLHRSFPPLPTICLICRSESNKNCIFRDEHALA
jgi:hypothetical protein